MHIRVRKFIMMVTGIFLIGASISLLRAAAFGTDPFTCMNLGISGFLNMQFGVFQLVINLVLILPVAWKARECIGLGTIINFISVGFIADFGVYIIGKISGEVIGFLPRLFLMIVGIIVICMGCSLYMVANMGISPYDAISVVIGKLTKIPFRWARIITDVIAVIIGFAFGSIVGVGTVVTAFCTGPLVQFFITHLSEPILAGTFGRKKTQPTP